MTAVAVWDRAPDARALLDARLERGWRPTPTAMKDGERVLGYAACAVDALARALAPELAPEPVPEPAPESGGRVPGAP